MVEVLCPYGYSLFTLSHMIRVELLMKLFFLAFACLLHCEKIHYTMVSGDSVDCSGYIDVKGSTLLSM